MDQSGGETLTLCPVAGDEAGARLADQRDDERPGERAAHRRRGTSARSGTTANPTLAATMPENGLASRRSNVRDPIHPLAQHCYEVALFTVIGNDHRERDPITASSTAHLQGAECFGAIPAAAIRPQMPLRNLATRFGRPPLYIQLSS